MAPGDNKIVGLSIVHNAREKVYATGYDVNSAIVHVTVELDQYDMVDVKKQYDSAGVKSKNYFEGWFMP